MPSSSIAVEGIRLHVLPASAERRIPAPYHEPVPSSESPVPARMTPVPPGCTVTAPTLSEVSTAEDHGLGESVSGTMLTLAGLPAALVDFQTPPPPVPPWTRLPLGSKGSAG